MPAGRIAIIGSGPIGLEAALYGRKLGYKVTVYERGRIAANVRAWRFVRLFTPWRMNTTSLGREAIDGGRWIPTECPTGKEFGLRYLLPLAKSELMRGVIRPLTRVVSIGKENYLKSEEIGKPVRAQSPFRLLLANEFGDERVEYADLVLDCSGTYGHHRFAGRGGIPAVGERGAAGRIWYKLPDLLGRDRPRFAGRRTLVVGCGFSAATALRDLRLLHCESPDTRVAWALRRVGAALHAIDADPLNARRELVQTTLGLSQSPPRWLNIFASVDVESILPAAGQSLAVTLRGSGGAHELVVDELLALVGYAPDVSLYDQLQIQQCYATQGPVKLATALLGSEAASRGDYLSAANGLGPETLKNPEPHFYILGAKSYGTNSNFLLQVGHRQVRDVYRLITGDEELDFYE